MQGETTLPVLDVQCVMRQLGGSLGDYKEVAEVFIEELPNMQAELEGYVGLPQEQAIALVHEFANTFGVLGACRAERYCRMTEHQLRQQQITDAHLVQQALVSHLAEVASEIDHWMGTSMN